MQRKLINSKWGADKLSVRVCQTGINAMHTSILIETRPGDHNIAIRQRGDDRGGLITICESIYLKIAGAKCAAWSQKSNVNPLRAGPATLPCESRPSVRKRRDLGALLRPASLLVDSKTSKNPRRKARIDV